MSGPFAEDSITMDLETGRPMRLYAFDPDGLPEEGWLHHPEEFDESADLASVVDRYSLPESDVYELSIVEVPPGESLRMGTVAGLNGRSGGGDLIDLVSREAVPDEWVVRSTTLAEFLSQ